MKQTENEKLLLMLLSENFRTKLVLVFVVTQENAYSGRFQILNQQKEHRIL